MIAHKKVGFELEIGSDTSLKTLRNKMRRDLGITGLQIHVDYSVDTGKKYNGELVTPVWNYGHGCQNLRRMLKWLRKRNDVVTDNTTGLHVNLSFTKKVYNKSIDPSTVLLMTDDVKWLKKFNRTDNAYCMTPKGELSYCMKDLSRRRDVTIEQLKSYMYQRVLIEQIEADDGMEGESDMGQGHFFDKYFSINLLPLSMKKPYIEYRFIGGAGWHRENKEVDVFNAIDHIVASLDKSISTRYEGVKTKYVRNMLTPAQKKRIKNK
tara:strand:+ start:84 stop:878 length:795 start_codon:yes stop_codon:yes gene_type:complete